MGRQEHRKLEAGKRREFWGQTTTTLSVKLRGKLSGQSEEQRDEPQCLKENEQGEPTRERDRCSVQHSRPSWGRGWGRESPMGGREAPARSRER